MVILGGSDRTEFSFIEYQALMLCLAGAMVACLFFMEMAMNRFQVLPIMFPGMFRVTERRFFFFNFDISDGNIGKRVRAEAKMLVRATTCLVLSYLWHHCVLETSQQVGTPFPHEQCDAGADCFASDMQFATLFTRQHEAIDCTKSPAQGEESDFDTRVVVTCIRIVTPSATNLLMHVAIAHSLIMLNFKAFELLVWIGGNSKWTRRFIGACVFFSLCIFLGLFLGGVVTEFVSSWLSFVMSFTIPMFLYTVYKNSCSLDQLWKLEEVKVQAQIEEHLKGAFTDIESAVARETGNSMRAGSSLERADSKRGGVASLKAQQKSEKSDTRVMRSVKNLRRAVSSGLSSRMSFAKRRGISKASTTSTSTSGISGSTDSGKKDRCLTSSTIGEGSELLETEARDQRQGKADNQVGTDGSEGLAEAVDSAAREEREVVCHNGEL